MNKDIFFNIVLDNLAAVNNERVNNNLSKERLIFNSGQREALTTLLEQIEK
jgi:esterase/lipase superfamily enzyme